MVLYAGMALRVILLAKLFRLGIAYRYRVLVAYLGFSLARAAALLYLARTGTRLFGLNGYSLSYVVSEPIFWVLYFVLLLEFYSMMVENFPGIRRLARLVAFSSVGGLTLACGGLMVADPEAGFFRYPLLAHLVQQERSVFLGLSGLTLFILLFLSYYRLAAPRNALVLFASFGGYFIVSAVLLTLHHSFGDHFRTLFNALNGLFFLASLLCPAVFLSRAGETQEEPMRAAWTEESEAVLLLQLRSMNYVVMKVLRQ